MHWKHPYRGALDTETNLILIILQCALAIRSSEQDKNEQVLNIFGKDYPTKDGTCPRGYTCSAKARGQNVWISDQRILFGYRHPGELRKSPRRVGRGRNSKG